MKRPVIIIGNGGHSKVLMNVLQLMKREVIGFTAPEREENPYGLPYLGSDEAIFEFNKCNVELVNGLGSASSTKPRAAVYEAFKLRGYSFLTVLHPSAIIADTVKIGEGVQIMAGTVVQPFAQIDDNTIVNTSASVDHDCHIGKHCHIAPGTVLCGGVSVGAGTHIGTRTAVIQNINIGRNVLVGAGSLLLNDVSDGMKVYGTPVKGSE